MKKGRVLLVILAVLLVASTAMAEQLMAVRAPKSMNIDGKLTEWDKAKKYAIKIDSVEYIVAGDVSEYKGSKDISAVFYVMWDDEYLYVAADVTDDELYVDYTGSYLFQSDGIQIFVSFDGVGHGRTSYSTLDFQFGFAPGVDGGFPEHHVWNNSFPFTDLQYESAITKDGYIIEVAIPAYELDVELDRGMILGLDVGVTDTDYPNKPQQNYLMYSKFGDGWANVGRFLELLLLEE